MYERKRRVSAARRQLDILDGTRNVYVNSEWTDWLISKRDEFKIRAARMTIREYKKAFLNQRPDWARTFSERDIFKKDLHENPDRYFVHILGKGQRWSLQREFVDIGKATMVAERINNMNGVCKQVAVIYPETDGTFRYRQEQCITKEIWGVVMQFAFEAKDCFYLNEGFLNLTVPMGELFERKSGNVFILSQ